MNAGWSAAMVAAGAAVLLVTSYDALRTTLAPSGGGGPITERLAAGLWEVMRRRRSSRRAAGTVILLVTVATWIVLLWTGWVLVLGADAPSLRRSASGTAADAVDVVYFAGYTLFTLGVGDVVPMSAATRLLTPVATLHGLFTITLAITYLLPVMSAAVERRRQAATIWAMGGDAPGIVCQGWHSDRFTVLEQQLLSLADDLLTTVERHPTYPVLHYFVTDDARSSFSARVAALDDAVSLMTYAVAPEARPSSSVLVPLRRIIDELLRGAPRASNEISDPPLPSLRPLVDAGIPLAPATEVRRRFSDCAGRRRELAGLVADAGYCWADVQAAPDAEGPG